MINNSRTVKGLGWPIEEEEGEEEEEEKEEECQIYYFLLNMATASSALWRCSTLPV